MSADPINLLILLVTVVCTFFISRRLSTRWRQRRRDRAEEEKRAGESRQVRRARERRGTR